MTKVRKEKQAYKDNIVRFRAKSKSVAKRSKKLKELKPKSHETTHQEKLQLVFFSCTLPPLPSISEELRDLLIKFNCLNEPANTDIESVTRKRKQLKSLHGKLNGFMAFRSFYCKSIFNPEHQRELSALLGKVWLNESGKYEWSFYAKIYNAKLTDKPFVEWLCESLGLGNAKENEPYIDNIVKHLSWSVVYEVDKSTMEDVFLV